MHEIEWRIRKVVLITTLCIYEENVTNMHHVWIIKDNMRKNNNLLHIVDLKYAFKINIINKSYNGNDKRN